jgi:hypothetical protein
VLVQVTRCKKTYLLLLVEQEGFAHVHLHIIPRPADLEPERTASLCRSELALVAAQEETCNAELFRAAVAVRSSGMEYDRFQPPVRSTTPYPTRSVESDEVDDLNHKLVGLDELRHITADELGLAETAAQGVDGPTVLPAAAKLTRLCCEGPQGFPYVHGHFDLAGVEHKVELHSATLTALGQLLHVPIVAELGD